MSKRNPLAGAAEPMKTCAALIRQAAYRHRTHQVFADFVEMAALAFSNSVDPGPRERREARYLEIVDGYSRDEVGLFPRMLACVVAGMQRETQDFLGQLFMSLELGNHWGGQFFTPYEVSSAMAEMMLWDLTPAAIERAGGFVTVSEPAAGAGAMVIAAADVMARRGLNYQRQLHVTAQDLDPTAVHMCYVQMSLMHIPGVVILGNSLALEERERWYTPAHVMGLWDRRLLRRGLAQGKAAAGDATPARTGRSAGSYQEDQGGEGRRKVAVGAAADPIPLVAMPEDRVPLVSVGTTAECPVAFGPAGLRPGDEALITTRE